MKNLLTQDRTIYKIRNTELLIAVNDNFTREIRECVTEYQSLEKVPVHRTVRGIILKVLNEHLSEVINNGSEMEYAISSLEFDIGNVRLTA